MPNDLSLGDIGKALIADRLGAPPDAEVIADLERLIRSNVTVPLLQCQFDGLAALLRDVGPGRVARSLGESDLGRHGLFVRKDGHPTAFLDTLDRSDFVTTAHAFTGWRMRGDPNELETYRWRLAQMLTFEGLPYTAALNACHSIAFEIAEAERIARVQAEDFAALKPRPVPVQPPPPPSKPEPAVTFIDDKPAPNPTAPPPAPAAPEEAAAPEPKGPPTDAIKHPLHSKTIIAGFVLAIMPDLINLGNQLIGLGIPGELGVVARIIGFGAVVTGRLGAAAIISIHAPLTKAKT